MRHSNDLSRRYFLKIYDSADDSRCITGQNCDQDRDNCQEFTKQDRTEYATPKVTKNTMIFLGSMVSSSRPALEAALADSSRPIKATTGPMAAGGSTILIQSVPNL